MLCEGGEEEGRKSFLCSMMYRVIYRISLFLLLCPLAWGAEWRVWKFVNGKRRSVMVLPLPLQQRPSASLAYMTFVLTLRLPLVLRGLLSYASRGHHSSSSLPQSLSSSVSFTFLSRVPQLKQPLSLPSPASRPPFPFPHHASTRPSHLLKVCARCGILSHPPTPGSPICLCSVAVRDPLLRVASVRLKRVQDLTSCRLGSLHAAVSK